MTHLTRSIPLVTTAAIVMCLSAAASGQYDNRYSPIYRQHPVTTPSSTYSDRAYQLPDRASEYGRARQTYFTALDAREAAQQRVARATSRLFREQISTGEAREAFDELQQARRAYQQARQEALQPLGDNPQFQEAQQRADRIDRTIEQVRYRPGTTQRDIVDLSDEQLRWAERAGEFKARATDSPEVQRTRREMVDAYIRLRQIEQQTLADVRMSPEVREAEAAVLAAESDWTQSRSQWAAARAGYLEALDERALDRRDAGGGYAPWMYRGVYDSGFNDGGIVGSVVPGEPDPSIDVGTGFTSEAPSLDDAP